MRAMRQIFRFRPSAGAWFLRTAVLFLCLIVTALGFASSRGDSLLNVLDRELDQSGKLLENKERYIDGLRKRLRSAASDGQRFDISRELYREYRYFQYDSALSYANRMLRLAKSPSLAAADYETLSRIALMECYTSVGLFKEADDMFSQIRGREIPEEIRIAYYQLCTKYYRSLASFAGAGNLLGRAYMDSVAFYTDRILAEAPGDSYAHAAALVARHEFEGLPMLQLAGEYAALAARFPLMDDHEKAVVHSQAGRSYFSAGEEEKALEHLAMSATYDLRSCTRETTAAKDLAQIMHSCGEIERADRYIHHALDDAVEYNSRHRRMEINSVLPTIETARYGLVSARNTQLVVVVILIAGLLVISIYLFLKLRRRNRSLAESHREIRKKTEELQKSNDALLELNARLKETAEIKDQYIIQSLMGNTDFIGAIEGKAKRVLSRIKARQYDEAIKVIQELGLKDERQKIYSSFDSAFLKLFPNFPEAFNALFPEEERMVIDEETGLPTDVRIYALMRLGIDNAAEVASYLNLSVNTVYVYKTKLKSKSNVGKEDFERMVMQIPKP